MNFINAENQLIMQPLKQFMSDFYLGIVSRYDNVPTSCIHIACGISATLTSDVPTINHLMHTYAKSNMTGMFGRDQY